MVDLDPLSDLLYTLLEKSYKNNICADLIKTEKINMSFFGLGTDISDSHPVYDIELAIRKILEVLKSHGKRLLICIDNIKDTESMQCVISAFQIIVREDLPVFLLIAGQREDIRSLQGEKNLTFLYRAPKVVSRQEVLERTSFDAVIAVSDDGCFFNCIAEEILLIFLRNKNLSAHWFQWRIRQYVHYC